MAKLTIRGKDIINELGDKIKLSDLTGTTISSIRRKGDELVMVVESSIKHAPREAETTTSYSEASPVTTRTSRKVKEIDDRSVGADDREIDKLLWKGKQPATRSRPVARDVNLTCVACERVVSVPAGEAAIYSGKESSYRCNKCCGSRR